MTYCISFWPRIGSGHRQQICGDRVNRHTVEVVHEAAGKRFAVNPQGRTLPLHCKKEMQLKTTAQKQDHIPYQIKTYLSQRNSHREVWRTRSGGFSPTIYSAEGYPASWKIRLLVPVFRFRMHLRNVLLTFIRLVLTVPRIHSLESIICDGSNVKEKKSRTSLLVREAWIVPCCLQFGLRRPTPCTFSTTRSMTTS